MWSRVVDPPQLLDEGGVGPAGVGWMRSDGAPLSTVDIAPATWDTRTMLRLLGAFAEQASVPRRAEPTSDGRAFASAALQTWPDTG